MRERRTQSALRDYLTPCTSFACESPQVPQNNPRPPSKEKRCCTYARLQISAPLRNPQHLPATNPHPTIPRSPDKHPQPAHYLARRVLEPHAYCCQRGCGRLTCTCLPVYLNYTRTSFCGVLHVDRRPDGKEAGYYKPSRSRLHTDIHGRFSRNGLPSVLRGLDVMARDGG